MWESVSEEQSVKKSECALSCCLVFPAARKRRERMCALSCWLVFPAARKWRERMCALSCWLVFPAAGKWRERMCALSCWLVFPAARKWRERMCALSCWSALSCSKGLCRRGWKNVTLPFYSCLGKWTRQNGVKYSHWSKIWVLDQNSQNIPAPDNNLKFFLLQVLDRNTWYHIIVNRLLVWERNTWNHIIVNKLLVLDRNTGYHMTVCKQMIVVLKKCDLKKRITMECWKYK